MSAISSPPIRRRLRAGDGAAIERLHASVYGPEYGLGPTFVASVTRNVELAQVSGWPHRHGAVWLIDSSCPEELRGALALVQEPAPGVGKVRWFALANELRGHGIGRRLLQELLAEAEAQGMRKLELETFSALTTAAHLYRSVGFELLDSEERDDWGARITVQHYALAL